MVRYFRTQAEAQSWSDLIDYRKIHVRSKKLVRFEDKVTSKKIAASCGCPIPKTYYVTKDPATIPFKKLPSQYVIKPSHLAGAKSVFLINDGVDQFTKKELTNKEIIRRQREYLTRQIDPRNLEWATGQIPRRTLVEEYVIGLDDVQVPADYKCYVFHGRVCMVRVDYRRRTKKQATEYFNRAFELIDFDSVRTKYPREKNQPHKPLHYDWMIDLCEKMGKKFGNSFLRIDMYLTKDYPMFGEFTLYPGSGRGSQFTDRTDRYMGALWKKPKLVHVPGDQPQPFTKEHFYRVLKLDAQGDPIKKSVRLQLKKNIKLVKSTDKNPIPKKNIPRNKVHPSPYSSSQTRQHLLKKRATVLAKKRKLVRTKFHK